MAHSAHDRIIRRNPTARTKLSRMIADGEIRGREKSVFGSGVVMTFWNFLETYS